MLNMLLTSVVRLDLALIVGGGVIMAAGVRPLLMPILAGKDNQVLVSEVEKISIHAWNRYNRFAFFATAMIYAIDVWRMISGLMVTYWHLGITAIILAALRMKFKIDNQLKNRLIERNASAVGSPEQMAGHRQVELLSKIVLVLAVILCVLSS